MMASTISCLVATAIVPIRPPSASEPVSPMKIAAGGALNQRKPRPAPITAPQMTASSPVPGTKWICRYSAKTALPDEIGDDAEGRRRDHHRHDGQAVEPVGQVHRIAGADDDEAAEGDEEPAEIEQEVLEEGEGQRRRERRLAVVHDDPGGDAGDDELEPRRALPEKPVCDCLVTLR